MYKKSYETLLDAHTKLKEGTLIKFQEIEIKDLQDQIAILKDLCKTHEHTCSKKSTINYHSWKPQLELFIRMRWNVGDIFTLQEFYYIYKDTLHKLHPNNRTIEASVQGTLQKLRDDSIISFIDNKGTYKLI